jgi:hypothetical protein
VNGLGGGATQALASQVEPNAQTVPHAPQLLGSLPVSTQTPPQLTWPDGHWHVPAMQDSPSQHGSVASQGAAIGKQPPPWQLGSPTAM